MYCSKCGIENSKGAKFCKDCGTQMGNDAETTPQTPSPVPQPPSKPPKSVLLRPDTDSSVRGHNCILGSS